VSILTLSEREPSVFDVRNVNRFVTRGTVSLYMVLIGVISQQGFQPGPLCLKSVIKVLINIFIDVIFDYKAPLLYAMAIYMTVRFLLCL
jgi:hypothetical protein